MENDLGGVVAVRNPDYVGEFQQEGSMDDERLMRSAQISITSKDGYAWRLLDILLAGWYHDEAGSIEIVGTQYVETYRERRFRSLEDARLHIDDNVTLKRMEVKCDPGPVSDSSAILIFHDIEGGVPAGVLVAVEATSTVIAQAAADDLKLRLEAFSKGKATELPTVNARHASAIDLQVAKHGLARRPDGVVKRFIQWAGAVVTALFVAFLIYFFGWN